MVPLPEPLMVQLLPVVIKFAPDQERVTWVPEATVEMPGAPLAYKVTDGDEEDVVNGTILPVNFVPTLSTATPR
jgi:hypothetical protein